MPTLTKQEILTQLKILGINTLSDLDAYLKEYKEYCLNCCSDPFCSRS